jgi:uncharacterized OB-fold protein
MGRLLAVLQWLSDWWRVRRHGPNTLRSCPRCGNRVVAGKLDCPDCGFDFRSIGA